MNPSPTPPQFVPPKYGQRPYSADGQAAHDSSATTGAILIGFFFLWLAFSAIIVSTDLIEPPARGVFFRLCLLATPFAIASSICGLVMLARRRNRTRAIEVQRADAMREPRV